MMGIPIAGPSYVYCDNNSVVMNSTVPASTLKKKSNSITYHAVRWSIAADEMRVTHIPSVDNVADILTKPLPGGAKRDLLVSRVLHDIVNEVTPMIRGLQDKAAWHYHLLASYQGFPCPDVTDFLSSSQHILF
jgi:hypothetical protein